MINGRVRTRKERTSIRPCAHLHPILPILKCAFVRLIIGGIITSLQRRLHRLWLVDHELRNASLSDVRSA